MKKIAIVGSGFSSLAASCYLAKKGYDVTVYEKNESLGGRASQFKREGFTFDMGPTWYWMPDVFERFFADFGHKPSDFYDLEKLAPAYEIVFDKNDRLIIEDQLDSIVNTFETVEAGSGEKLKKFIQHAKENYNIAITDLVYKPGVSPLELVSMKTFLRLNLFVKSISNMVRKEFKNPKLVSALEFPVLFLGAKPSDTPAFYNFMNYADFGLGTWHPKGGMYQVVNGMVSLAEQLGVKFEINSAVSKICLEKNKVIGLEVNGDIVGFDCVLSGADYHHTEKLLPKKYRQYSDAYWNKKTFAPSSLLFYVGLSKEVPDVSHHTLFFDVDFDAHAFSIYDEPSWPEKPLFYASFPSKTDDSVAPKGKETAIFLIPLAPGIEDSDALRETYFDIINTRFKDLIDFDLKEHTLFKESFCLNDFIERYNSYKGNAYGMANTLFQTAFLRPKLRSKKVKGLYFSGQLTVPGPGVPPSLISGKLSSELLHMDLAKK